jgi:hypothetical protein
MTIQTTGLAITVQDLDDGHIQEEYCQPSNLIFIIEQLKADNYRILSIENTIYEEHYYTDDVNNDWF